MLIGHLTKSKSVVFSLLSSIYTKHSVKEELCNSNDVLPKSASIVWSTLPLKKKNIYWSIFH